MWQTIISIDRRYIKAYNFIVDSLNKTDSIAYAIEDIHSRHIINVAANPENLKTVKPAIENIVIETLLTYFKFDYFMKNVRFNHDNYLNSALLSALICCDRPHEMKAMKRILQDIYEYSIDALYRFRMSEIASNWEEVSALVNGMLHNNHTASDVYSLIQFIMDMSEGEKSVLKIIKEGAAISIRNVTRGAEIHIPDFSDASHINIMSAIIAENPYEILLEKDIFNSEMTDVVNNIAKLKTLS